MDIIGRYGVRGYFLKKFWIKLSIILFLFVFLPILDIVYFIYLMNADRGGLLINNSAYSGFEEFVILFNLILILIILSPLLILANKDDKKSEPAIVLKNKKDTAKDVLVVMEIFRKAYIFFHNFLFRFSFHCYKCKNVIKVDYHTNVECHQCSHYGKLSSKLLKCKCHSILRYIECPHCGEDLDLIKHFYEHKKLKLSKYE